MYLESAGRALILLPRHRVKSSTACLKFEFSRLTLKEAKLILKLNQNLLPHLSQEGQGLAFLGNITSLAVNDLGSRRINPKYTKRSHLCQIKHLPSLLKVTSLSFSLLGVGLHLVADLLPLHDLVLLGLFLGVVASVGSGHNVMLLKV